MLVKAVRGATVAKENSKENIILVTKELLQEIVDQNKIDQEDIISIFFSVTPDLTAEFPAAAARALGWTNISLLCMQEIKVEGAIQKCIRVLFHFNTAKKQAEIKHVYLKEAKSLRPDLK